ncbi:hypothetical protein K523DRAFT_255429 [Schizophyllum commune Tattone D]|nr:hypothetical protein K523DRAFT_255429 [Schizophyllum commune Tattone D]
MNSPPANGPLTPNGHSATNGHPPVNGHASSPPPPPPPTNEYARTPSPRIQIDYQNLLRSCRVVLDGARALQSDFTADVHFKPPIEALETMFAAAHANVRMMRGERGVHWEVEVNRVSSGGQNGREDGAGGREGAAMGRNGQEAGGEPRNGRESTTPVKVSSSPEAAKMASPEASRGLPPPPAVGQSQLIHAVEGEGQTCLCCDATTTPEWRRGPMGPRTLCNACGLVYAKMVKKRQRAEGRDKQDGSDSEDDDGMDVD